MIEPLGRAHVDAVATLHAAALTGLLTQLGPPAVRAFYAGAAASPLAIGFVAVEEGRVRGFVLGAQYPAHLRRDAAQRNRVGVLVGLGRALVRNPLALLRLAGPAAQTASGDPTSRAELMYLAVATDHRGLGVGAQLVNAFTNRLRSLGAPAYDLSVDEANAPAISFYERLGFRLAGRYHEFGIARRRYRLALR